MDNILLFVVGCLAAGLLGALVVSRFLRGADQLDDEPPFFGKLSDEELSAGRRMRPE
jgi:hypothetical protein